MQRKLITKYIHLYKYREISLHTIAEFRLCSDELNSKFPPRYLVLELSQL